MGVAAMPLSNLCSTLPWRLQTKFGFDWQSGPREKPVLILKYKCLWTKVKNNIDLQ